MLISDSDNDYSDDDNYSDIDSDYDSDLMIILLMKHTDS